jgi:hypothetical protein
MIAKPTYHIKAEEAWRMMRTGSSQIFPGKKANEMADFGAIVAQLKAERAKLDRAIEALSGVAGKSGGGGTRKLSAAARAKIAAAQRSRWAKFKAKKKGS